uniref:Lipoyltransferase 1, mitochondrial n=1 Tax=Cacopsylla melanoneura TaxID=428564 RepID=A0A8D8UCF7_9HEMI
MASCLIKSALVKLPQTLLNMQFKVVSSSGVASQVVSSNGVASRYYSSKPRPPVHMDETKVQKSVFISQSSNIFTNLALEDWLYKNFDFTNHHVMLLWRNNPCVVIGRHQNPWQETNLGVLYDEGIEIARRNSGGGTVYHDLGNLNVTFFTPRERYNRRNNLEIISRTLEREFNIQTEINTREDIVYDGKYKISGTAAKLGRPNSYHHCTLLVDVNKSMLHQSLHQHTQKGIISNATASTPAPTLNLQEISPDVTMDRLIKSIGYEYLRTKAISMEDGEEGQISKQRGFQTINPTDDWFPGLAKIQAEYQGWDWRYGSTPKFTISQSFDIPDEHSAGCTGQLVISLEIVKGLIESVCFKIPPQLVNDEHFLQDAELLCSVQGRKFTESALDDLKETLTSRGQTYLGTSLDRVVTTV